MAIEESGPEAALGELSAKLNEGLKSCHAVVENYRAMLSEANDNGPSAAVAVPASDQLLDQSQSPVE